MEFKEGEWIIRKWKDENGGEIDFVRFKEFSDNYLLCDYFFRYGEHFFEDLTRPEGNAADLFDRRIEWGWRKPNEDEIIKYLIMEPKPFNI